MVTARNDERKNVDADAEFRVPVECRIGNLEASYGGRTDNVGAVTRKE